MLIHHYVQRGHDWDKIAGASFLEKVFLQASMEKHYDEECEKYKAMFGEK